jgi:phosphoserine phosphatase
MREHLKKFFTSAAGHHTQMAKLAESAMNTCEEDDPSREMHKTAMDSHINHAQTCTECAKACSEMKTHKIAGMDDEIMPLPEGFSRIAGDAPAHTYRMVPRTGGPPVQTAPVAEGFQFLARVDGGDGE